MHLEIITVELHEKSKEVQVRQHAARFGDTLHCTISMKPSEVTRGHVEWRLWWHQYKPKESYVKSQQMCKVPFRFKRGDHMRIFHVAQTFQWGHDKK